MKSLANERRSGRAGPSLSSKWRQGLLLFWLALLWIGEIGLFYLYYHRCRWNVAGERGEIIYDEKTSASTGPLLSNISNDLVGKLGLKEAYITDQSSRSIRIAIIADPQLTDRYSYKQHGLLLYLTQFYSDLYLRRAFRALVALAQPTTYVFLGDLLDGGREWKDSEYESEMKRLRGIFHLSADHPEYLLSDTSSGLAHYNVYYVAGNHDIGFGKTTVYTAIKRFQQSFNTPLNYVILFPHHLIIVVNTMALEDKATSKDRKETLDFLVSLEQFWTKYPSLVQHRPRFLFTHVPLWRPDDSNCGPLRTSRTIHQAQGYQFQNLISEAMSLRVLRAVEPMLVFSGDDHDQCTVVHRYDRQRAVEHTVGTFSWLQGNAFPSVGLLNVQANGDPLYHVCFLPPQLRVYGGYLVAFLGTLGVLCMRLPPRYYGVRPVVKELVALCLPSLVWYAGLLVWSTRT